MLKAEVNNNKAKIAMTGNDLSQIGTDLTTMFHAIIDAINSNMGEHEAHCFKVAFLITFMDGLLYNISQSEMKRLVEEAIEVKTSMKMDALDELKKGQQGYS